MFSITMFRTVFQRVQKKIQIPKRRKRSRSLKSGDIVIKEAIGIGDNEVDALNDAKKQLGLDENAEVDFEVIQRAEKKKFGLFGGQPAKVRVTLKETPAEKAEQFLRDVLDNMKLESVMIEKKEIEGGIEFNLSGEDVGFVIGRRGETIDSLQYLTSLVANHSDNSYFKVTIDTGNYREKREKTLEILGRKLAFKAVVRVVGNKACKVLK